MNRRQLFLGAAALTLAPLSAVAQSTVDYQPGLVEQHLANGDTVFLEFSATWCSTCRTQGRVIQSLRTANPAYDAAMTFIRVDWDRYGRSDLARELGVPRRSTLVVLRGEDELGRIVAGTREADIRALLDSGLS